MTKERIEEGKKLAFTLEYCETNTACTDCIIDELNINCPDRITAAATIMSEALAELEALAETPPAPEPTTNKEQLDAALRAIREECRKHKNCKECYFYTNLDGLPCGVQTDPEGWVLRDEAKAKLRAFAI